jgi:hypothetical protein
MTYEKKLGLFFLVIALVVIGFLFYAISDSAAATNLCARNGFTGVVYAAGDRYCYQVNQDEGDLVSFKKIIKLEQLKGLTNGKGN